MFASPSFRVYNNRAQENRDALMARKPGVSNSARKPLADRTVNESKTQKLESVKPKILNKPTTTAKKVSPKINKYPDWVMETCSFKEIEDTYEDIFPKSQRLNKQDFLNMVLPKTPPPREEVSIDPMFLELPQQNFLNFQDEVELERPPIDDVEFPDFDSFVGTSF